MIYGLSLLQAEVRLLQLNYSFSAQKGISEIDYCSRLIQTTTLDSFLLGTTLY